MIIEATGDPGNGIKFCLAAIEHGKHVVMVNVEADALAGPLLARRAKEKGVVYSLAWGDQPALVCEHVDWARACGFKVASAGKGTRYHPTYHGSNPDTIWGILKQYLAVDEKSLINPKMFNSFIDGTKSGIEMTAICNATGLESQTNGLAFPPATRFELSEVCKPKADGGTLEKAGVTEVVSSLYRDMKDVPHHLAMGTYVVIEGETDYARQCFREYHILPDKTRQVRVALSPDAHDRPGTRDLRRVRGVAPGADGIADLLQFGRGGDRQEADEERRDPRRRGWLLRLGQAAAGAGLFEDGRLAAWARAQRQTEGRRQGRPDADVERCRVRCDGQRRQISPRDGSRVREAECVKGVDSVDA